MEQSSQLGSWIEWKERCALGLCSPDAQSDLRRFAEARFRHFLWKFVSRTNVEAAQASPANPADPWHLFETHLTLNATAAGKQYKNWLLARVDVSSDPAIDVIQGGATLLIRDVVREYLRREFSPGLMRSLEEPCRAGDAETRLEDLLPGGIDPSREVERREFQGLARERAVLFFAKMDRRERLAFLAKHLDIPLADPLVQQAARCGKSVVHAAFRDSVLRLIAGIRAEYRDDGPEAVRLLALTALGEVNRLAAQWGASEPGCAQLFHRSRQVEPLQSQREP